MDNFSNNGFNAGTSPAFTPVNNIPQKQKRIYPFNKKDGIFLGITSVLVFLVVRLGFFTGFNLGFGILFSLFTVVCAVYISKKILKNGVFYLLLTALIIILSVSFGFNNDYIVKFFASLYIIFLYFIALTGKGGSISYNDGSYMLVFDAFVSSLKNIFENLSVSIKSISESGKNKKKGIGAFLIGIAISLPVLCIIIPLLVSSDVAFKTLVSDFLVNVSLFAASLVITVLIIPFMWSYLFGLKNRYIIGNNKNAKYGNVPPLTLNTLLIATSVIYIIYLVSQLAYITKTFAFLLPEDFSAAQFARQGFFQMAAISFINLVLIAVSTLAVRHNEGLKLPVLTKIFSTFLCAFTLFYISTAFIRMQKYISIYGLTRLRVLTSVFMVMLALIFIVILIRIYFKKVAYMKIIIVLCAVTLAGISFADINTLISEYNYKHYMLREISIDVEQLQELGVSSLPVLTKLTEDKNQKIADDAVNALLYISDIYSEDYFDEYDDEIENKYEIPFFSYNTSYEKGRKAILDFLKKNPEFDSEKFRSEYYTTVYNEHFNAVLEKLPERSSVEFHTQGSYTNYADFCGITFLQEVKSDELENAGFKKYSDLSKKEKATLDDYINTYTDFVDEEGDIFTFNNLYKDIDLHPYYILVKPLSDNKTEFALFLYDVNYGDLTCYYLINE